MVLQTFPQPQRFHSINRRHRHYNDPTPTREGIWQPQAGGKYIGTVWGARVPLEVTLLANRRPDSGSLVIVDGVRATLQVEGPMLPDSVSILEQGEDFAVIEIRASRASDEQGYALNYMLAMIRMTEDEAESFLRTALLHHHLVVFNFTNHNGRPPRLYHSLEEARQASEIIRSLKEAA